jgi:TPP-dependent pyruvate/acetoin dehydrogenase alpha subunit
MPKESYELSVLHKALQINSFERNLLLLQERGVIDIPVYLGIGQEYVAASLASLLATFKPAIFAQHRAHSYYLAFGGDENSLLQEILGNEIEGCARGYGGSVGLISREIPMFGHSGVMGEQAYIGSGWALATKKPALIVMGDATIEEDYVGPILGFSVLRNLPVLFVCEDNGLAVLTPTSSRRLWSAKDLASAYGMRFQELEDNPLTIRQVLNNYAFEYPLFLNIKVQRKNRHVGAMLEGEVQWDREILFREEFIEMYGMELYETARTTWFEN